MNSGLLKYEEVDFLIRLLEWHRDGLSCSYDMSLRSWPSENFAIEYQETDSLLNKLANWCAENKKPTPNMTPEELKAYVDRHRNALIASATEHMEEEDGRWDFWGDVAMCIYYDRWEGPENPDRWYRICAFPLIETDRGMMEEDLSFFTHVADIKTRGIKE